MRSKIYTGSVVHSRLTPVEHSFSYPIYFYALELDELEILSEKLKLFSYNSFSLSSIYDKDYFLRDSRSIKEKLYTFLEPYNILDKISRVTLITSCRYLGYVFNPVSFYYCFDSLGKIVTIVAEVNNTFGEKHLYILTEAEQQETHKQFVRHYTTPKAFHVSPFYQMTGEYDFWFSDIDNDVSNDIDIRLNVIREGKPDFYAKMYGKAQNLTDKNLLHTVMRYPLTASLTMPRILIQAAKLHYIKKLPAYKKPIPNHPMTIQGPLPTKKQKLSAKLVLRTLSRITKGRLEVELPDARKIYFGELSSKKSSTIQVKDYRFFTKLIFEGDVGLGEAYTENYFETDNLTNLIELLIENREVLEQKNTLTSYVKSTLNYLAHTFSNANTLKGNKENIRKHYDLSNDMFSLFLDKTMTYSCGIFADLNESQEQAQNRKLQAIIDKAQIKADHHILEIGTGWGSLAIKTAKQTGCKVTTITLSEEQAKLARQRIKEEGLEDRVEVKISDFRQIKGSYDRIVSVEMLEAIGKDNFDSFFNVCQERLKQNGLIVVQVITIPDFRYKGLTKRCDWIQKHIFPGSLLPSITALSKSMEKSSQLQIEHLENIGPHYAPTLLKWKEQFNKAKAQIVSQGFDQEFIRTWNYYFSYCAAAFRTRTLNVMHIVLSRPCNKELIAKDINSKINTTSKEQDDEFIHRQN